MDTFIPLISQKANLPNQKISATLKLLQSGATIPFISRYRKEATGGLNEVEIKTIEIEYSRLQELVKRKTTILNTLKELEKLTPDLNRKIEETWDATSLEDLYLPYRPKRRTRAEKARELGLEPLAEILFKQKPIDTIQIASQFLTEEVKTEEEALSGARDIIAEQINEDSKIRQLTRTLFDKKARVTAKVIEGKETEGIKYKNYFDFNQPLYRCSSHQILALLRAQKEEVLRITVSPDDEEVINPLIHRIINADNEASSEVEKAIVDGYKRLLKPSIETETINKAKERADEEAIRIFEENLRQLLLAPPLGQKRTLGIDPGFRTGCKVVCLDEQGNLLHNETIYPHPPVSKRKQAASTLRKLVEAYQVEVIAIGNGTASRETEAFVTSQSLDRKVQVFTVSEQGASIYSASSVAREEFPDYDVTVRGAVSIARRLMDPLAELVKIDPKSIGVGQYQHDVNQVKLKKALDTTVESCVNTVGVNLNTASKHLLLYISGLGPQLAQNIVDYRTENGPFRSRKELMKVPRMGEKSYEQCAGFLRIPNADNPLDNTAVHPESYPIVEAMAKDLNCSISDLIEDKSLREKIKPEKYITEKIGIPTLTDIQNELDKPGRDPRKIIKLFEFDRTIQTIEDLKEGQILPGIVNNITNFGAFIDIGIKENGLVHLSQLAKRFITDPTEVVSIHQHVKVKVLNVDLERKRIQLT
ncbi:MAG: RNA-binding transcriptional accessory protein, partial [Bacteroidales bacterium]|nr:RNA-binding transcriptional accessory protein [Bacteroidales bacterium]